MHLLIFFVYDRGKCLGDRLEGRESTMIEPKSDFGDYFWTTIQSYL
jgi:hypothetical protein